MRSAVLALALVAAAGYAVVSPELEKHIGTAAAEQLLPVHVILEAQFDCSLLNSLVDGMPKPARRMQVARILQQYSAEQQAGLLAYLHSEEAQGRVRDIRALWIVNGVYCEATPAVIRALSERSEVNYVDYDLAYAPDLLEPEGEEIDGGDEIAWGVRKVNAPAVWSQGFTGAGIVCGHIDTGCNYNHPDLADHMWTDPNYPNHGWNFESNNHDPMDVSGHGTHTAGTVASDGTSGTQAGVAPDAQIMVCRVKTSPADSIAESQCWQAMQFCVSPPLSPSHGADLYTMSLGWYISWNPKQATWRTTANNVNAAGLSQIVAAGNERSISPPNSCRCPGNVPPPWWNPQNTGTGALSGIVSIGATDSLDAIAGFSSRGPVTWQTVVPFSDYAYPPGLTRPDVSAPGVDVKSCARTGGYTLMDGTSMATPHTAGTVCLMLSKNPALSPAVVDSILEITADDLGPNGKDNDFGAGRIDALEAVNYITGSGGPMIVLRSTLVLDSPPGGNGNGRFDPNETGQLQVTLRNSGGAACNNTVGTLRSGDARFSILDSLGAWGNIPSGGEATNTADRFQAHASGTIPPGTFVPCTLLVSGDSADYSTRIVIALQVGTPPRQPGEILWGPKLCPGMAPDTWGLYGVAYNPADSLIYCVNYMQPTIYKYTSDTLVQARGTIAAPEDSCTDIDYCAYDNTFWLLANSSKKVYKITATGSVLRQFTVPQADYPCGLVEHDEEHKVYVTDRRLSGQSQQRLFVYDTLGAILDTIIHPVAGYYGTRCLALDYRGQTNPPTLLNMYSWFDATGTTLDSCGMLEVDRVGATLLHRFKFTNTSWNMRGIEDDPRDGSYWVTIMQGGTTENQILKVVGFNYGVGIEEPAITVPHPGAGISIRSYPNPFVGSTALSVKLAQSGDLDLLVYDNNGRLVRALARGRSVSAGESFVWDGCDEQGRSVAPGIYFYRARTASAEALGKVVLSR